MWTLCDLVVWTNKGIFVVPIPFDEEFVTSLCKGIESFWYRHILPVMIHNLLDNDCASFEASCKYFPLYCYTGYKILWFLFIHASNVVMFDWLISVDVSNDVPVEERIGCQNVTKEVQSIIVNDVNIYKTCTYMWCSNNQASYVILYGGLLQENQRLPNHI